MVLFDTWVINGRFPSTYGGDFLAFWSAGKIADVNGYSEIYDLNNLRITQSHELARMGFLKQSDGPAYSPIPAPLFPIFILPFHLLSKLDSDVGYWIWTILNSLLLIGYLVFFTRKIYPENKESFYGLRPIIFWMISFPVFDTLINGQVQVFLLVCAGEFIRHALNKKPVVSGLWLGGLLIKPQLLILIIPVLLICRYWKIMYGFLITFGSVLLTSILLSGISGLKSMALLWAGYGVGIASNNPEYMINWRMVGVNLNSISHSSTGWFVAGLGILLTTIAVWLLIKHAPPYGTASWVMLMLGIFAATLLITWHSHYHMAIVLIPFFISLQRKQILPDKTAALWIFVTPLLWVGTALAGFFLEKNTGLQINQILIIAFSGFMVNFYVFITAYKLLRRCEYQEDQLYGDKGISVFPLKIHVK